MRITEWLNKTDRSHSGHCRGTEKVISHGEWLRREKRAQEAKGRRCWIEDHPENPTQAALFVDEYGWSA